MNEAERILAFRSSLLAPRFSIFACIRPEFSGKGLSNWGLLFTAHCSLLTAHCSLLIVFRLYFQ